MSTLSLSEDIFHQRGITLLYRTSNLIIQSGLYGKFCSSYVLLKFIHRSGIYASLIPTSTYIMMLSYLISFWTGNLSNVGIAGKACAL